MRVLLASNLTCEKNKGKALSLVCVMLVVYGF